jgi:hypothetical protein
MNRAYPVALGVVAVLAAPVGGCAGPSAEPRPQASGSKTVVFVLGTIHGGHVDEAAHYSLHDLGTQIAATRPDVLCGEIQAEHHRTPLEGLFPPEAVFVEHVASESRATFYPSDWRGDFDAAVAAEAAMSQDARQRYEQAQARVKALIRTFRGESLFDLVHDPTLQAATRLAHETRINLAGEAADGHWTTRNRMIVERCLARAADLGARRLTFVFGGDHVFAIEDELRRRFRITTQATARAFVPGRGPVPASVLQRWLANAANLRAVLLDPSTALALRRQIERSGRIDELQRFIAAGN